MMAFALGKLLFKGDGRSPAKLPDDLQQKLEAWRASSAPALDEPHFHTRYVVLDVTTSGARADDELKGIAALGVKAGSIVANDAFAVDFTADAAMVDRQLIAFLTYAAKAPLVTYHVPFVSAFLERAYKERLGVDFQPQWIDLTWLLPSLFKEKSPTPQPLDAWLDIFGLAGGGRRDTMSNALMLARLFQILLARANTQELLSAGKLVEESRSASFLRRSH
jgi:DNA polymerase III subunit epsilon